MDLEHLIGPRAARGEWLRGAVGGTIGLGLTVLFCQWLVGANSPLPWIIAPMGATTVLLFEVPASQFSRPWPVLAGHVVSGAIGLATHRWLGGGAVALGLAVGLATAAMCLARCLHPPAGGTALLAALGNPALATAGWQFLLVPVATNAAALVLFAAIFHRLTGHSYPHRAPAHPAATLRSHAELERVLGEWGEVLDISADDIEALLHRLGRSVSP